MNKTLKTLGALLILSEMLNAQDIINVKSYELSGMTDYLLEKDIDAITDILAGKTGDISYEQLKNNEENIQKYFDNTYGTKFKINCVTKEKETGIIYYDIMPVISKITYNQGESDFKKAKILSLKIGGKQDDLDKRDLQIIEENPNRNLLLKYSLSPDGYLTANLIEDSKKEPRHRLFVDNYGKSDKRNKQFRYGYQYLNYNTTGNDDVLGLNVVRTLEDLTYFGMYYHNPIEELHGEFDMNLGYGISKKKFLDDVITMKAKNFEADVRYLYNLPIFMDNYEVKNKIYVGARYIISGNKLEFLGQTVSKETKHFFIPYVGYYFNKRMADKYFDFDLKLEGNTKSIEEHLSKNYAKLSMESNFLWQFQEAARYYLKVEGALSSKILNAELSNDLITQNSVRATRKSDNSIKPQDYILIKNELEFGKKNTIYVYNDYALAREYNVFDNKTKTEKIDTFGIGFRLKQFKHFKLDTNIGYDIVNTAASQNESKFVFGMKAEARF